MSIMQRGLLGRIYALKMFRNNVSIYVYADLYKGPCTQALSEYVWQQLWGHWKIFKCILYPEKCCKENRVQLNNGKSESICGWYAVFKYMNENQLDKMDDYTGKMTKHSFHACPDESKHQGNIFWVDFIKVARNK